MALTDRADFELLPRTTQRALARLAEASSGERDEVDFSADPDGRLVYLSGRFGSRTRRKPEDAARLFLAAHAALFGLDRELSVLGKPTVGGQGREEVAVQLNQVAAGVPVFSGGFRVEVNPEGNVTTVCGRLVDTADASPEPKLSREDAVARVRDHIGLREAVGLEGEVVLTDIQTGIEEPDGPSVRAAWHFRLEGPEGTSDVLVEGMAQPVVVTTPGGETEGVECPTETPLYHLDPVTGVPDFVTFGPAGTRTSGSASGQPERAALAFFTDHPLMFGTGDVANQLRVTAVQKDPGPPHMSHVVLQQRYGGMEVFGAELRVHLTPSLSVSSISGRYLRDPRVVPEPLVQQYDARDTAVRQVRIHRGNNNIPGDPALDVKDDGIGIFPGELTEAPYARNAVAWRFRFPEATVFVDARSDEILSGLLFAYPHHLGADRNIYDANTLGEISFPTHVMKNSTAVPGTPQNAEVAPGDTFLGQVLGFYAGLGRSSWDGNDSPGEFVTNSTFVLTPTAAAHWDIVRQQAWFQTGTMGAWLAGHEFTHGVTMATAFLMPIDEPGALNEHYSDVMGSAIVRSFAGIATSPSTYAGYVARSPVCAGPLAVFSGGCDSGNVHTNCAIGNSVAISLTNGDGTAKHAGIGWNRFGRLFFDTLTTRMHPWSTYIDERLNTWEVARDLASRGVLVIDDTDPTKTITFGGVANEVTWAFRLAGIDPRLIPGWFRVIGGITGQHSGQIVPWYVGQSTPTCFLVGDIEMVVRALDPLQGHLPWWEGRSRVNGPGAGSVAFPGGVFGASIVSHSVGTRAKDTDTTFFHSGFLPFDFHPVIIEAPDPDPACAPVIAGGPPTTSEFTTPGPSHWDIVLGGKGTDLLNWPLLVRDPALQGCIVDLIEIELLDKNGQILARTSPGNPPAVQRYGPLGALSFGVEITRSMLGSSSPGVDVHWWFDIGSAVRYRVHYYCTGDSCDIR